MKVLYFDTETTGLPKSREPATRGSCNWPHLVSIAWIVNDVEKYFVIKPNWKIPEDSIKIHGITQEYAEEHGTDLREVITQLINEKPDVMVAHNMNFYLNVLTNAILWDLGMSLPKFPRLVCTMEACRNICKIPVSYSKTKYKSPKLSEVYEHIFHKKPENLHNALGDTRVMVEIIKAVPMLRELIGLIDPKQEDINDRQAKRFRTLQL